MLVQGQNECIYRRVEFLAEEAFSFCKLAELPSHDVTLLSAANRNQARQLQDRDIARSLREEKLGSVEHPGTRHCGVGTIGFGTGLCLITKTSECSGLASPRILRATDGFQMHRSGFS